MDSSSQMYHYLVYRKKEGKKTKLCQKGHFNLKIEATHLLSCQTPTATWVNWDGQLILFRRANIWPGVHGNEFLYLVTCVSKSVSDSPSFLPLCTDHTRRKERREGEQKTFTWEWERERERKKKCAFKGPNPKAKNAKQARAEAKEFQANWPAAPLDIAFCPTSSFSS